MNEIDRPFSRADRRIVDGVFGYNNTHSPRQIAMDADYFTRSLKIPAESYQPDLPPGMEVENILNRDFLLGRFFEDHFREPQTGNAKELGKSFVNGFRDWQEKYEEEFYIKSDKHSLIAADILHELTVQSAFDYAQEKAIMYSATSVDFRVDELTRSDAREKRETWTEYTRIAKWATAIQNTATKKR